jgi:hypothetical protein
MQTWIVFCRLQTGEYTYLLVTTAKEASGCVIEALTLGHVAIAYRGDDRIAMQA